MSASSLPTPPSIALNLGYRVLLARRGLLRRIRLVSHQTHGGGDRGVFTGNTTDASQVWTESADDCVQVRVQGLGRGLDDTKQRENHQQCGVPGKRQQCTKAAETAPSVE